MGHFTQNGIDKFWPDDTDDTMHIEAGLELSLLDILDRAVAKWGGDTALNSLIITAEHVHTDCLGYDAHDAGDYTNFIVITRNRA